MRFALTFKQTDQRIAVGFESSSNQFDALFSDFQTIEHEAYTGEYEITPTVDAQTIQTAQKIMRDDMTVHAIPFFDVGNPSGGSTVYIGTSITTS